MIEKSIRLPNADVIRVVAMIMVIMLHTILAFSQRPDFFPTKIFFLTEIISAFSKSSVLLFFMLSGYLVVSKERTVKENNKQTTRKIIIPLLFFTLINILIDFSKSRGLFSLFVVKEFQQLLTFPNSPLWFLVVLAPLYLLNPVWHRLISDEKNKKIAQFICFLLFTFTISSNLLIQFKPHFAFSNFTAWIEFACFYFYGALLKKEWLSAKNLSVSILFLVCGYVGTLAGDWFSMSNQAAQIVTPLNWYTNNYLSVPVTLMAIGTFNFLLTVPLKKNKYLDPSISFFSKHSFGIYLLHPYVITFLTSVVFFTFDRAGLNPYLYNVVNIFVVVITATLLTYFWRKSPSFKFLLGE